MIQVKMKMQHIVISGMINTEQCKKAGKEI